MKHVKIPVYKVADMCTTLCMCIYKIIDILIVGLKDEDIKLWNLFPK